MWERLQWWTFPRTRQLQSCVVWSYPKKTTVKQERPPATSHMCTYKSHNLNLIFHEEDARRRRRWDARRLYNFITTTNDECLFSLVLSIFLRFEMRKNTWNWRVSRSLMQLKNWFTRMAGGGYNKWAERKKKLGDRKTEMDRTIS